MHDRGSSAMPAPARVLQSPYGGLTVHELAAGPSGRLPLVCLHPAPFDGTYFAGFAAHFPGEREIWAPDYPGYGGSAPPPHQPGIDNYAAALLAALSGLLTGRIHLLGFHTGCLVACEMALQAPDKIADLVLIDVPYYDAATQREKYAADVNDDPATWAFGAAFSYPCAEKLAAVSNRALLIGTGSKLGAPTAAAAAIMPDARLENCPDITRPVFSNGGALFAQLVGAFLHG